MNDRELAATLVPALPFQERLLLSERLTADRAVHPIPVRLRLSGPLDPDALRAALAGCVRRHEALRTGFETVDGRPHQVVVDAPGLPVPLRTVDLTEDPGRLDGLAAEEAGRPFDPTAIPQARAVLVTLGPDEHELLLTVHHAVCDGSSIEQLVAELVAGYGGEDVPPPRTGLLDWTARRLHDAGSPAATADLDHWLDRLDGVATVLELPADRPRTTSVESVAHRVTVESALVDRLRALGRAERTGFAATLLAGLAAVLHAHTGQDDFCVGVPLSLRDDPALDRTVGPLLTTVAVRLRVAGTFRELVRATGRALREAQAHTTVPFERVLDSLALPRSGGLAPLFQVMFTHERVRRRQWDTGGVRVRADIAGATAARNDLTVAVTELDDRLDVLVEHRADIFDPDRLGRLAGHLRTVLAAAAGAPDRPVVRLPLLDATERDLVLRRWNDTDAPVPATTAAALFAACVARDPDAPAIHTGGTTVTYGELDVEVETLARHLADLGAGRETLVGVGLPRGRDAIVALLAVHRAGAAYLPLDPSYPPARLAAIVTGSRCATVVTRPGVLPPLPVTEVHLDAHPPGRTVPVAPAPDDLAYVIHTSGSTGVPNGVAVTHRSLVARVLDDGCADFGPGQAVLNLASLSFDASVSEVWAPLCNGGAIVVPRVDQPFLDQVREGVTGAPVTTLQLVSPQLPLVLDSAPELFDGVSQVVVGGDLLSPGHAAGLLARRPGVRFTHVYGPTECTLFALTDSPAEIDPGRSTVPLGRPLANTRIYLLDAGARPVPLGSPGEIHLAGVGVARGYLHQPALTARRFLPDPFGPPGTRMYRTGDLGRFLPDGRVEFLGRVDHQVKIRGFRVEVGEVEATLCAHPGVREAAVVVRDGRLVAHVVPAGADPPDTELLRGHCRTTLPEHLVPAAFSVLDRLPLTRNGKVDRAALPAPAVPVAGGSARTPVERELAALWARVLDVPDVPDDTNFFLAGGDSIRIAKLYDLVDATWPGRLRLAELFELGTVRTQAAAVLDREERDTDA
ncbi:hypothetical protein BLA60_03245 [Actinophytocola xinjiangensis]|uniref:Carrier domain-containing protein n=1 Tax=Actinophytocola xinjiangensis TaxID=485602 RepID=A0A7Z0WRT8_9PSEU|nr:non-ribosomal peptide synthetase [Actinophytocola xinjiangensis]OLF14178.1 hypothetical protein BLA60_03245 [Actinophytocola xinjiangensis]